MTTDSVFFFWIFLSIHIAGLLSTVLTRMSEGRCCQTGCQFFFLMCLAKVGFAALVGFSAGPEYCLMSGATLAAMVIGVISEFGRNSDTALAS